MKKKSLFLTAAATLVIAVAILLPTHAMAQNVPSYVPTNGLVGWWPFTGNANDASVNSNNGTVNGAILTTDRFGNANNAYAFNSSSAQSINANIGIYNTPMTFSAWFKAPTPNRYYPRILTYGNSTQQVTVDYYQIGLCGNEPSYIPNLIGKIVAQCNFNNSNGLNTPSTYIDNQWHNLTVIYNPSDSIYLYLDGVKVNTVPYTGTLNFSSGSLYIGRDINDNAGACGGCGRFLGSIDDVGVWSRSLTQQEVTNLYNSTTNACPLITSITLNAQQTQTSVTNTVVGYLPNSNKIISDTTQWHYIALTKSGSTGNFYFDGTLVTSSSFANNPYIWNSLLLGATQGCVSCSPVADFNGLIDEVRVSNVARTASNIASAYSANSPFTADVSTIGLFHLDNTTGNSINNAIGGTAATFGTPALASGKFGQAMSFDGVDDYVRWSSSIPVNNMTIEFWVKSSDQSATMAMLEYAYNTGIYLQSSTVTNPILWSTGDTTNTITVNPTQLPYVWVSNGSCSDTIFFNSQSATQYDTVTTTINDTVTTYLSVTDTLKIDVNLTGINPPNNSNLLTVYPNPAKDHLLINCGNYASMSGYSIKITNTLGQIVFNQPITQQQFYIDLSTWGGAGTYIMYITDQNQTVKSQKQIVLQ